MSNKNYIPLITFIIPTIGRKTLNNSIQSIINQSINNWKIIIIFDGLKSNIIIIDERIKIVEINKLGINTNNAALVRNYGMSLVNTEWIAFLDDDDIIASDYIETFYNEIKLFPKTDLLIFRMNNLNKIIPKLNTDNFYISDVGISFIMKKKIYDNKLIFNPSYIEDFIYLDKIRKNNYKIMISPYVKYFIRTDIIKKDLELGSRIFINFDSELKIFFGYLYLNSFLYSS